MSSRGGAIPSTESTSGHEAGSLYAGTMQRKRDFSGSPKDKDPKRPRWDLPPEAWDMSLYAKSPSGSGVNTPALGEQLDVEGHAEALKRALRLSLQIERRGDVWDISLLSLKPPDTSTVEGSGNPASTLGDADSTRYLELPSLPRLTYNSDNGSPSGSSVSFNFEKELNKM